MLAHPPLWFVVVAFVCALGPLVFFHELGHYFVARLFKVPAEVFSIGFGRELIGWTDKQGTRWKVAWLPLGGYVKFVGDMGPASTPADLEDVPEHLRDRVFQVQPVWQRFLIVLAGPFANFVLAIAIIAGFIAIYGAASTPNLVVGTVPHTAAERAHLKVGDRIVSIAGRSTSNFEEISQLAGLYPDQDVRLQVSRNGQTFDIDVHLGTQVLKDRFGQAYRIGLLGIPVPPRQFERVAPKDVLPLAVERTAFLARSMFDGLWQIITGQRSLQEIGGPIKIAKLAGDQASLGGEDFIALLAFLSINLGFINLLPVPMLDGGHLFFYAIEAVRRRPLSARALDWAFRGGLALILALLVFVTVNDLGSLGLWDGLQRLIG
ncbi:MAG TPA: RIP metalloprotease RseP [Sphingomicrobium sp.]|nr:RIP metalloprotease RseP [Sphingomicrobium sp.]